MIHCFFKEESIDVKKNDVFENCSLFLSLGPSQKLDFEHPDLSAVLPGQKEIADLSCGDSWGLGLL